MPNGTRLGLRAGPDDDEYDGYVGKIATMIREGATDEELFAYLNWAETEHMGLPGNPERLTKVIATIRAVGRIN